MPRRLTQAQPGLDNRHDAPSPGLHIHNDHCILIQQRAIVVTRLGQAAVEQRDCEAACSSGSVLAGQRPRAAVARAATAAARRAGNGSG